MVNSQFIYNDYKFWCRFSTMTNMGKIQVGHSVWGMGSMVGKKKLWCNQMNANAQHPALDTLNVMSSVLFESYLVCVHIQLTQILIWTELIWEYFYNQRCPVKNMNVSSSVNWSGMKVTSTQVWKVLLVKRVLISCGSMNEIHITSQQGVCYAAVEHKDHFHIYWLSYSNTCNFLSFFSFVFYGSSFRCYC